MNVPGINGGITQQQFLVGAFRIITFLGVLLVSITGYLAKMTLDDLKTTANATLARMEAVSIRVYENKGSIDVLDLRVDQHERRLDSVDRRIGLTP